MRQLSTRLLPAAALSLFACAAAALAIPAASVAATPAAAPPLRWHGRLAPALAEATATDRLLLVDLYADWCSWCKVLERDVFSTSAFRDKARGFVLVRIDVDRDPDGAELQARYGAPTLPTMLILDRDRVKVGVIEGAMPLAGFLARIDSEIADHRRLVADYERALGDADVEAWRRLAGLLHERADGARAAEVYTRLLEHGGLDAHAGRWTRYLLADAERLAGRFDAAQVDLDLARRAAAAEHDDELAERADLLRFYLAQDRGDCRQAKSVLEAFLRDWPQSDYGRLARHALEALRQEGPRCA